MAQFSVFIITKHTYTRFMYSNKHIDFMKFPHHSIYITNMYKIFVVNTVNTIYIYVQNICSYTVVLTEIQENNDALPTINWYTYSYILYTV